MVPRRRRMQRWRMLLGQVTRSWLTPLAKPIKLLPINSIASNRRNGESNNYVRQRQWLQGKGKLSTNPRHALGNKFGQSNRTGSDIRFSLLKMGPKTIRGTKVFEMVKQVNPTVCEVNGKCFTEFTSLTLTILSFSAQSKGHPFNVSTHLYIVSLDAADASFFQTPAQGSHNKANFCNGWEDTKRQLVIWKIN